MQRDGDAGVYVISVAADLAGLHPQTLRLYERKGLVEPARTEGGNRRYSDRDLARLGRIGELTAAGVNLEGVRRILELQDQVKALRAELERARASTDRSAGQPRPPEASSDSTVTPYGRSLPPWRPGALPTSWMNKNAALSYEEV